MLLVDRPHLRRLLRMRRVASEVKDGHSRAFTEVLDHLVIGQQRYVSLKECGLGFGG